MTKQNTATGLATVLAQGILTGALSRENAAEYVGVSAGTFDKLVAAREMPRPRCYRNCARKVWLRRELDAALDDLPTEGDNARSYAGVVL